MTRVSIIICTLNREKVLCETVRAVLSLLDGRDDAELLVIDQTRRHEPETEACLSGLAGSLQWHRVDFASLTRARNHGVRLASGGIILFLDDDVVPEAGLIDAHLRCYDDPGVVGVGGCTLHPGERRHSRTELSAGELQKLDAGQDDRFDIDWERDTSWTRGCNMSFRRDWLFRVGGFDEAFYGAALGEEVELCHRLRQAGGRLRYAPDAGVLHLVNPSGGCRDEVVQAERLTQVLRNTWFYWTQTGVPLPAKLMKTWRANIRPYLIGRSLCRSGRWLASVIATCRAVQQSIRAPSMQPSPGLLKLACGEDCRLKTLSSSQDDQQS